MATTPPIDRALVLESLGLSDQDWGNAVNAATYAEFADGWRGVKPVPLEADMTAAWTNLLAAHPEYGLTGAALQTAVAKIRAKAIIDSDRFQVAFFGVLLDEINRRREWDMGVQAAVANATGATPAAVWSDFKTRIAALPAAPDLQASDVIAAVKAAIDAAS